MINNSQEPEPLEKNYQEPEPFGKKSGAGVGKKLPGSTALIKREGVEVRTAKQKGSDC